ncbi:hypothetical protein RHSIM_Rhsim07G0007700 [Rhododendron simsii]|uniref:Uncharacterized protein n=1 Tax=Rhododendron simsii TaxID=118357 RepID=A0A834LK11_RHOSS|nr:hypothetical protein RHSIM_Rhsim07G0007700 [Rhododendron simsii]
MELASDMVKYTYEYPIWKGVPGKDSARLSIQNYLTLVCLLVEFFGEISDHKHEGGSDGYIDLHGAEPEVEHKLHKLLPEGGHIGSLM